MKEIIISNTTSTPIYLQKKIVGQSAMGKSIHKLFYDCLNASTEEIFHAYAASNAFAQKATFKAIFENETKEFWLAGVDLMVTDDGKEKKFNVIEINSAPGFAYCTPGNNAWHQAYEQVVDLLLSRCPSRLKPGLAILTESVIPVETFGFQACLSQKLQLNVPVLSPSDLLNAKTINKANKVYIYHKGKRVTGGIRYIHKNPWDALPPETAGVFLNNTHIDLRGGRNKISAQNAFEAFNKFHVNNGLKLELPDAKTVLSDKDLQQATDYFFNQPVVVKKPFENSGVGVFLFSKLDESRAELISRMAPPFLIQKMLAPSNLFTDKTNLLMVSKEKQSYAFDLRIILGAFPDGIKALMVYGRHGRLSLEKMIVSKDKQISDLSLSNFLKVNISSVDSKGRNYLDESRLILPDVKGAELLDLEKSDILRAITQAVFALVAVDTFGSPLNTIHCLNDK